MAVSSFRVQHPASGCPVTLHLGLPTKYEKCESSSLLMKGLRWRERSAEAPWQKHAENCKNPLFGDDPAYFLWASKCFLVVHVVMMLLFNPWSSAIPANAILVSAILLVGAPETNEVNLSHLTCNPGILTYSELSEFDDVISAYKVWPGAS